MRTALLWMMRGREEIAIGSEHGSGLGLQGSEIRLPVILGAEVNFTSAPIFAQR
jgi:hypothetical protein